MTPAQCSAGRSAVRLTPRGLGQLAGLMTSAVHRFERGDMLPQASQDKLRAALSAAGVEFIVANGSGVGVRLRQPVQGT